MEPSREVLTDHQMLLLERIAREPAIRSSFYLTGGTALAGFYLEHRYSEDLDFFSEQDVEPQGITIFLQSLRDTLPIRTIDFQQSFNRNLYFLHFPDEILKVEFTYFPFPRIEVGKEVFGLPVDSPIDIAVNKLFTIYQQPRARDYIDLYCLVERYGWTLDELARKARIKFDWHIDPLQLGTQFMKADDASDLPRMILQLPEDRWRSFFTKEAEQLKPDVLED